MTKNSDRDSDKPRQEHGFIPSHLPQSIGRGSDELRKALAEPTDLDDGSAALPKRRNGRFPVILRDALIVLAFTVTWGLIAGQIWPVVGIFVLADWGFPGALAVVDAMTDGEISQGLDGWFYFVIGQPISVLLGFTVVAAMTSKNRLKHVLTVAFIIWLVNLAQLLIGTSTLEQHAFSLIKYAVLAMVAVGLSYPVHKFIGERDIDMTRPLQFVVAFLLLSVGVTYVATASNSAEAWIIKCDSDRPIKWDFSIGKTEAELCISIGETSKNCFIGDVRENDFRTGTTVGREDQSWLVERWTTIRDDDRIFRNHFVVKEDGGLHVEHLVYPANDPGFHHSDWAECLLENKQAVLAKISSAGRD